MPSRLFVVAAAVVLVAWAVPAAAKTYAADRYDIRMELQRDGSVRVTETIVIRFEDGPFQRFFREIPTRRTDGIEFETAWLDGRALEWGDRAGQAELSGRSKRRVTWHFEPMEYGQHEFTLAYRVRGVIRKSESADQLIWRALPSDHDYTITSSLVTVVTGAALDADPVVRTRRVDALSTVPDSRGVVVAAQDIGRNGYVELHLEYPPGALVAEAPAWQQRRDAAAAAAVYWLGGGLLLAVLGLIPLIALSAHHTAPPAETRTSKGPVTTPPDDLTPALAGVLMSAGRTSGNHALSMLFSLANQGAITIVETEKRWLGQRRFEVRKVVGDRPMTKAEQLVLDTAFRHKGKTESRVSLVDAARRLRSGNKPLQELMRDDIVARGFWDEDRARNRKRHVAIGAFLMIVAGLWAPVALLLLPQFLAWPLLLSAGLLIAGFITYIMGMSRTPLSNEGVRRTAAWREYAKHLKAVARGRASLGHEPATRVLATAVALGLAADWARYMKKHPEQVPEWFECTAEDGAASMAALIAAVSVSSGSAGGAGAAGGAAGGGASGAG